MEIIKIIRYKAIEPLNKEEIVCDHILSPIELRSNEEVVYNLEEFDPKGKIRELYKYKDNSWSSEESEQKAWEKVKYSVIESGVARFITQRFRSYEKTPNMNLCQRRRKFRKMSDERICQEYKCNYQVGYKTVTSKIGDKNE